MTRSFLLICIIGYFSYDSILLLIEHGWPFETVQWCLCAVIAATWVLAVLLGKRLIRQYKEEKAAKSGKSASETTELDVPEDALEEIPEESTEDEAENTDSEKSEI